MPEFNVQPRPNFMMELHQVVAGNLLPKRIEADFEKSQEKGKNRGEVTRSGKEWAHLSRQIGSATLAITLVGTLLMVAQVFKSVQADVGLRDFISYAGQHGTSGVNSMVTSGIQSKQRHWDNVGSLALAAINNPDANDASAREQYINFLKELSEVFRSVIVR